MNTKVVRSLTAGIVVLLLIPFLKGSTLSDFHAFLTQKISIPDFFITREINLAPDSFQEKVLGATDARGFEEVVVSAVIDGDTVELSDGRKLRYIGMNTPETKHPTKGKECFGEAASARNKELVLGKIVQLERDVSETDRYGRLLRYVWIGETLINEKLVAEGFAYASSYPPDIARQSSLKKAETEARINSRGLWESCDTVDLDALNSKIKAVDLTSSVASSSAAQSGCVIKGNLSQKGKLFHVPTCSSYAATRIDEANGEMWFCTEEEALKAGWVKAGGC